MCSAGSAIEIKDVSIGYKGRGAEHVVARSINATLNGGEVVALIGCNGAGKSTLLRVLGGYEKPLEGSVIYNGVAASEVGPVQLARFLAVVLTDNSVAASLTVRELVSLGRTPYTDFTGRLRSHDKEVVDWAISAAGVEPLAHRAVGTLSDGERQKCMIAKALAQETPVVMLDEPTAFLDFGSKVALFRMLQRLAREMNKAVIVSTHDVELALRLADRLWLIDGGTLHCGTADELSASSVLDDFIAGDGITYNREEKRIEII
ncbi:MAG: ABC transporter ATP-binding protein [Bacteroidaceae bacterium]|nr:ABC transporter ATP-binding protein [Bacteroidaceae bacterium]